jgi:hypothetical protein
VISRGYFAQFGRPEAGTRRRAGREVLDEHVGFGEDAVQQRGVVRVFDVGDQALLAAVEPDEIAGQAVGGLVVAAREVAFGALDLDDARAGVGEAGRTVRRRDRLFERDDQIGRERQLLIRRVMVRVLQADHHARGMIHRRHVRQPARHQNVDPRQPRLHAKILRGRHAKPAYRDYPSSPRSHRRRGNGTSTAYRRPRRNAVPRPRNFETAPADRASRRSAPAAAFDNAANGPPTAFWHMRQ